VKGDIVYVPSARCRHLYNQSAAGSAEAASQYARSELLYLRKWGGAFAKRFEGRHESLPPEGGQSADIVREASPLASFETAAGHFGSDATDISEDIWSTYRGDVLHLRDVDRRTGRVLHSWAKARIRA
jgi:hypothetical protein